MTRNKKTTPLKIDEKGWRVRYIKLALMMQTGDMCVAVLWSCNVSVKAYIV